MAVVYLSLSLLVCHCVLSMINKQIIIIICILLTLLVLPCLCWFFFQFPYFFFFSLAASATSSFHHHVSFPCMGLSTIHMWPVLFPSFVASVHLHAGFPLCFRYRIFDCSLVFFTCLFLLEFPYVHSWYKFLMPFFVVLNAYSRLTLCKFDLINSSVICYCDR